MDRVTSPPGAQHPPRRFIDGEPRCIFSFEGQTQERFNCVDVLREDNPGPPDTFSEYLSLSEHSALLSQAAAEARAGAFEEMAATAPTDYAREYLEKAAEARARTPEGGNEE